MPSASPASQVDKLKACAAAHGDRLALVAVDRLAMLKDEIEAFGGGEELNGFQRWILEELYRYRPPATSFPARSVILVALPHPPYAQVQFAADGRHCDCQCLVMADFAGTHAYLSAHLASISCHLAEAPCLPLKRLAARSGLAVYGRNNICYVEGMGSYFSLAAYFTDLDGGDGGGWKELRTAASCDGCRACIRNCPTGAIREGRFLIDNERCLSCLNERGGDFPAWLPKSAHHGVYDCLRCQNVCPMNRPFSLNVPELFRFNDEETGMILAGRGVESFPPELKRKAMRLGLHRWPEGIPRNLRILFETLGTPSARS